MKLKSFPNAADSMSKKLGISDGRAKEILTFLDGLPQNDKLEDAQLIADFCVDIQEYTFALWSHAHFLAWQEVQGRLEFSGIFPTR